MLPGCGSYENEIYALANACDDHEPLAFSCMIEEMGQDFPLLADLTSRLPLLSASTYIPYFALPTVSPTEGLDPATAHMPIQGSLSKRKDHYTAGLPYLQMDKAAAQCDVATVAY